MLLMTRLAGAAGPAPPAPEACQTYEAWAAKGFAHAPALAWDCPRLGVCDDPVLRDRYLVDATSPKLTIAFHVSVALKNDRSGPSMTDAEIVAMLDELKQNFAPHAVGFFATWEHIAGAWTPRTPEKTINLLVFEGGNGQATFPWDPDYPTSDGGIYLGSQRILPPDTGWLTHEVGHNLGLWHTHHGTSEVPGCGACAEHPRYTNRDRVGDLCSDTPATDTNPACADPTGSDPCNHWLFAPTDFDNFMGYGAGFDPGCFTHFTAQQAARFRCWTVEALGAWLYDTVLYRRAVPVLSPDWKSLALPLGDANDDPVTPFPIVSVRGQRSTDDNPPAVSLTLYRALGSGVANLPNVLRVAKSRLVPGGVDLRY